MFLRKKGTPFFILHYTKPDGKDSKKSTKCNNKADAKVFVTAFIQRNPKLMECNTIPIDLYNPTVYQPKATKSQLTITDFKLKILEFNKTSISSSTNEIYLRVLNDLQLFYGDIHIIDLTTDELERYKSWRLQTVKPATVNIEIITLRRMFNLALKWKILTENPATELQKLRIEQKEILTFNDEEFQRLLKVIEEHDDKLFYRIAVFGYYTGARLGEIINLQWLNIDFRSMVIKIINKENFKTKSRRNRFVPISKKLECYLMEMYKNNPKDEAYLFPNPWGFALTKHYVSRKFIYYCKKAGLFRQHFHCLRHTFITNLLRKGVPIIKVMKLVGHSQISTTMRYTHLIVDDVRNEVDLL
jgi:integrase/recombinase XerD